ncbi:MAG: DUF5060 domain-containing protein [Chthonomonadales bacterium]|nr:DUF5060 domain-containing protein [Chthonomonadales bacterium]
MRHRQAGLRARTTRIGALLAVLALSAPATAQVRAEIGPRGEVTAVRVGGATILTDLAVSIVRPGWTGNIVDQRGAPGVTARRQDGAAIYSGRLTGAGPAARLREVVRTAPGRVTLRYELTPEADMDAECVLLQGLLPAEPHAGRTAYVVAERPPVRGTLPARYGGGGHVLVGSRAAEWIGFSLPSGAALRVTPDGLSAQLQDNRRWDTPAFGLLLTAPGGRLRAGVPVRFGVTLAVDTARGLGRDASLLERGTLAAVRMADSRRLAVRRAAPRSPRCPVYGLCEVTAEVAATYDNPFDPDQIAVDAEITRPDGRRVTVPGFFDVPMRLERHGGAERLLLAGEAGFRVRYAPTMPGKHLIVIRAKARAAVARSAPMWITATAPKAHGFVRRASRAPHAFAFDDGAPYVPVGLNLCWATGPRPVADYAAWLRALGKAGGNWARLWLAYNEKGMEWSAAPTPKPGTGTYAGLGRYALDNAWRLDEIVRLAGESGVRLMLCMGTYGEFTEGGYFDEGCWVSNPYNAANGGPCATPADFWTDARARKLYQRRLRYAVARWGWSPAIFAWEFWNEVPPTAGVEAWVAEMAGWLKRNDPNRHMVSTTYGSPAMWRCRDVDFTMTHMYGQAGGTPDFTDRIARTTREMLGFGKPYLLAEFGIDWQKDDGHWDPRGTGTNLHNGGWAALLSGAAGTAMLWYWDGYVAPRGLFGTLAPVRRFADTVPWPSTPMAPVAGITVTGDSAAPETFRELVVPAEAEWGRTPGSVYTVGRDGSVRGGPVAMTIGSPARGNPGELFTQLTWRVDMPASGRVYLRLGQVCQSARLVVKVDGETRVDRALAAGEPGKGPWKSAAYLAQYGVWTSDYDEDIALDLATGPHAITVANTEGDWLQIRSVRLPAYRSSHHPDVRALALGGRRLRLLWLQNGESTWRAAYEGRAPAPLSGLRVRVPADDGLWKVEWWDTWRGVVTRRERVRAAGGALTLAAPSLTRDVAARCERL